MATWPRFIWGPTLITVPNVVGLTEADAIAQLTNNNLSLGTIAEVNSATIPAGVVITSDPATNQQVPGQETVNLVISNGRVQVADVRNLDVAEARRILIAPEISYTVSVQILDAEICLGDPGEIVLQQSILPGLADQLQEIILYVDCVNQPEPEPDPSEVPPVEPAPDPVPVP